MDKWKSGNQESKKKTGVVGVVGDCVRGGAADDGSGSEEIRRA